MRTIPIDSLRFINLADDCKPSAENCRRLARLIYDTDPYIYPAMFGNAENASLLIPQLLDRNDSMFRLSNCFVALEEKRIIGLILWVRGSLSWSPELLRAVSESSGIPVSPYLDLVSREYVDTYEGEEKGNTVSLINVSVLRSYRGGGVGKALLNRFFAAQNATNYELCVLRDNISAVELYKSCGFAIVETYNGFSTDRRRLPALRMEKRTEDNHAQVES